MSEQSDKAKWTVDGFTPSDGSKMAFVTVDHEGWLKREGGGKSNVYIKMNISSNGVPADEAKTIMEAMLDGLNASEVG